MGVFLFCIAGLLHDAIEDATITEDEITKLYGKHTAEIVVANSKDTSLPKEEILQDIVTRCADHSEDALIVKFADVLDDFAFYTLCGHQWVNMEGEIRRCKNLLAWYSTRVSPGTQIRYFLLLNI